MTGNEAYKLRTTRGENQTKFWQRVGVTQSGGCRYEHGRNVPEAVSRLLRLVYLPEGQATKYLQQLRRK